MFSCHEKAIMDVDWRNEKQFATCSADTRIYVWELQRAKPLIELKGHQNEVCVVVIEACREAERLVYFGKTRREYIASPLSLIFSSFSFPFFFWRKLQVNTIKWDPSGRYLASCSDDFTARLWQPDTSNIQPDETRVQECMQVLKHSKEIYTLRWSPTGNETKQREQRLVIPLSCFWDGEGMDIPAPIQRLYIISAPPATAFACRSCNGQSQPSLAAGHSVLRLHG